MSKIYNWFQQLRQKFEHKSETKETKQNEADLETPKGLVQEKKRIYEDLANKSKQHDSTYRSTDQSPVKKRHLPHQISQPESHTVKSVNIQSQQSKSCYSANHSRHDSGESSGDNKVVITEQSFIDHNHTDLSDRNHQADNNDNANANDYDDDDGDDGDYPNKEFQQNSLLNLPPHQVTNDDGVCVYNYPNIGSFKNRGKFNQSSEFNISRSDNEIVMRNKDKSPPSLSSKQVKIKRYRSILNPDNVLFQQQIVVRGGGIINPSAAAASSSLHSNRVSSLIDHYNQQQSIMDQQLIRSLVNRRRSHAENNNLAVPANGDSSKDRDYDNDDLHSTDNNYGYEDLDQDVTNGELLPASLTSIIGPQSMRWINMEQVSARNLNLSKAEIEYQELQFELIQTEASYYHSLTVLLDVFYLSPELSTNQLTSYAANAPLSWTIKPLQKEHLFSSICKIHNCTSRFLEELEIDFSSDIFMSKMYQIISKYARSDFEVYVPYLQNQKFQTEAYNQLKKDEKARSVIEKLEQHPQCRQLSLDSFLLLPMQRLLRLLLLLEKIQHQHNVVSTAGLLLNLNDISASGVVNSNVDGRAAAATTRDQIKVACDSLKGVIDQCSAKKVQMDERTQMIELIQRLDFKKIGYLPLASGNLLAQTIMKRSIKNTTSVNPIMQLVNRSNDFHVILTNQYIVMTKVANNNSLVVDDAAKLSELQLVDVASCSSDSDTPSTPGTTTTTTNAPSAITPQNNTIKITINRHDQSLPYSYIFQPRTRQETKQWLDLLKKHTS